MKYNYIAEYFKNSRRVI